MLAQAELLQVVNRDAMGGGGRESVVTSRQMGIQSLKASSWMRGESENAPATGVSEVSHLVMKNLPHNIFVKG